MNGQAPRRPPASHGWLWLADALKTIRRWPGVFLPMGLIVAIIQLIPYLGGLALLIMGPALVAGTIVAAQTATGGGTPAINQLFAMFEQPARRSEALKLCLPLLAGKFIALVVIAVALTNHMVNAGMTMQSLEGHPEKVLALLGSNDMVPWLLLAVAIVLVAWTFAALAIPRVALQKEPAFEAMRHSLRLVWSSIGAWIVAAALLFACMLAVTSLLMLTQLLLLVQLGLYTVLYAVLGPLLHAAWRDITGAMPPPPAPDPRPRNTPPPPSGVLEA